MQRFLHESRVTAALEEEQRQRAWAEWEQVALGPSREGGYNAQDNPPLVPHPSPAEEKVVVVPKQKAMPEYADSRSQAKKSPDK